MSAERAFVTGAASGIGAALAEVLAGRGFELHLIDVDGDGLAAVADRTGAATATVVDVADWPAMAEIAESVGTVDLLCLNAGVVSSTSDAPWTAPPEEWSRVFGVNVFGVVNGLRAFVPGMLEAASQCRILITASLAGAATWPGGGPYGASKHATLAVAEQAAMELAGSGITVTALCPALVRTGMSADGDDPIDVVHQALQAVDEGRFAVIPDSWGSAVQARAADLVAGKRPSVPSPDRD